MNDTNDTEPDTTVLRRRLHELAAEVQPDLDARAANAVREGSRSRRVGGVVAPLAAAAATVAVVGTSYFVASGGFGDDGTPPAGSPTATLSSPGATTPTPTTSPSATAPRLLVVDRKRADVDGDGRPDTIVLSAPPPGTVGGTQQLKVTLGSGGTSTFEWPNRYESSLLDPTDLDGDGDQEVLVSMGGGEFSQTHVYAAANGEVRPVSTVDANGKPRQLYSTGGGTTWQSTLTPTGFVDYRWTTADPGTPPFPVEFRRWTLQGLTLTRSDTIEQGCYDIRNYRAVITTGGC